MSNNAPSGGITFVGALGLLFIGLKLGHVIDWSWWLVTLPLWGGTALIVAVVVLVLAGAAGSAGVRAAKRWRELGRLRDNPPAGSRRRMSIGERRDGER